jgi:hypothetical protein
LGVRATTIVLIAFQITVAQNRILPPGTLAAIA